MDSKKIALLVRSLENGLCAANVLANLPIEKKQQINVFSIK